MLRIWLRCPVLLLGLGSLLLVQGLPSNDADVGQSRTVQKAFNESLGAIGQLAKNDDVAAVLPRPPNATRSDASQALAQPVPTPTSALLGQQIDDSATSSQNQTRTTTTEAPSAETSESSSPSAASEAEPTQTGSPNTTPTTTTTTTTTLQASETASSPTTPTTSTTSAMTSSAAAPSVETETTKIEVETSTTTSAPPPEASEQPEGMSSGIIALVMAIVFAIVVVIVYAGLLLWRRYLEYRYGNRELLVNDLEFDTNDLRHFEL